MHLLAVAWYQHERETVAFAAFLAACAAIYRYLIRPAMKAWQRSEDMWRQLVEGNDWVQHQMKTNNGSTMRDSQDRIEKTGAETAAAVAALTETVTEVAKRVGALETRPQAQERTAALETSLKETP